MKLKDGDIIYINSFLDLRPDRNNFFCTQHFKDLIGFPVRVSIFNNRPYVSHPTLDLVELDEECVNFEKIEGVSISSKKEAKEMLLMFKKIGVKKVPKKSIKNILRKKLNEQQEKIKLSDGDQKLIQVIKIIEDEDNTDILHSHLGGPGNFINALSRRNLINYINPFKYPWRDMSNNIFPKFIEKDPNFIEKIIDNLQYKDIQKIGNNYYFNIDSYMMASFFYGHKPFDKEELEQILDGNEFAADEFDSEFYNTGYSIYQELGRLSKFVDNKIVLELKNRDYLDVTSITPELFDDIMEEQGNEGEIKITDDVIERIMNDQECIEYLINNELEEIEQNLIRLVKHCENSTLWGGHRKKLIDELVRNNIIDDPNLRTFKYKNKYGFYEAPINSYKVTNSIRRTITNFLNDHNDKNYQGYSNLFDFSSFRALIIDILHSKFDGGLEQPNFDSESKPKNVLDCIEQSVQDFF